VRYDRRTGERLGIHPWRVRAKRRCVGTGIRPILISRILTLACISPPTGFSAATIGGNSWKAVSGDLTRQTNRNTLPVWARSGCEAIERVLPRLLWQHHGACGVPKKEGLLYAGTTTGLVQVTRTRRAWRQVDSFPGVPDRAYVARLLASHHECNTIYTAMENHKKRATSSPIYEERTKGRHVDFDRRGPAATDPCWPSRGSCEPNLLFVGTDIRLTSPSRGKEVDPFARRIANHRRARSRHQKREKIW